MKDLQEYKDCIISMCIDESLSQEAFIRNLNMITAKLVDKQEEEDGKSK